MEHPLIVAVLLVLGFNLGLLLIRLFGPPETNEPPEDGPLHAHDRDWLPRVTVSHVARAAPGTGPPARH